MKRSEEINELAAALAKAQAAFTEIVKESKAKIDTKDGKGYEYKYANLAALLAAVRGPLAENGLALISDPSPVEGGVDVVTTLMHASGQWIESTPIFMGCGPRPQEVGSAITYARRYSLAALLCLAADDDDGKLAHDSAPDRRPAPREGSRRVVEDDAPNFDRGGAKGRQSASAKREAENPEPFVTDPARVRGITSRVSELATYLAKPEGEVWFASLEANGIPHTINVRDQPKSVINPRYLRLGQAAKLESWLDEKLDWARTNGLTREAEAAQSPDPDVEREFDEGDERELVGEIGDR